MNFVANIYNICDKGMPDYISDRVEIKILNKIRKAKRGSLFFTDSFAALVNTKAVNKALKRIGEYIFTQYTCIILVIFVYCIIIAILNHA